MFLTFTAGERTIVNHTKPTLHSNAVYEYLQRVRITRTGLQSSKICVEKQNSRLWKVQWAVPLLHLASVYVHPPCLNKSLCLTWKNIREWSLLNPDRLKAEGWGRQDGGGVGWGGRDNGRDEVRDRLMGWRLEGWGEESGGHLHQNIRLRMHAF